VSTVRAGFTLLELLVVLALAAALAALAAPRLTTDGGAAFERVASQVAGALEESRRAALVRGVAQTIAVAATAGALDVAGATIGLPTGVDVELSHENLVFFPDGSTSGAVIDIRAGGRGARVSVSPLTGRIAIDRLETLR
jgi:prepilin-type N-terminal cleavage/methylation domain-containing protein